VLAGFGGAHHQGIANAEVIATCMALHVPRPEWGEVLMGVRVMVNAARPVLNEKKD
jgi:hypothetical protein